MCRNFPYKKRFKKKTFIGCIRRVFPDITLLQDEYVGTTYSTVWYFKWHYAYGICMGGSRASEGGGMGGADAAVDFNLLMPSFLSPPPLSPHLSPLFMTLEMRRKEKEEKKSKWRRTKNEFREQGRERRTEGCPSHFGMLK